LPITIFAKQEIANLMKHIYFLLVALSFSCQSSSEDSLNPIEENPTPPEEEIITSELSIHFRNTAGVLPIVMRNGLYTNSHGEKFSVDELNYYISNIVLEGTDENGESIEYTTPKDSSYFLIRGNEAETKTLRFENVPVGDYHAINFMLGVDSTKSVSGVDERIGDLDVIENSDMYWQWNSGYIFFKMEGTSKNAPEVNGQRRYTYHIGGFGGYDSANPTFNNARTIRLEFFENELATVREDKAPIVFVYTNVRNLFDGVSDLKISENYTVMFSAKSVEVADNLTKVFEFDHLHNYDK
jgi:hypothetical protein